MRNLCVIAATAQVLNVEENLLYEERKTSILKTAQRLQNSEASPIIISLYFTCYQMLESQTLEAYQVFETFLKTHQNAVSAFEFSDLLILLTSFCSKKINTGDRSFLQKSLEWYELGFKKKVFIEEGVFSMFIFKNIVHAAVLLERYDWAVQFIEEYSSKLYSTQQDNLKKYALAIVYFNQGQKDCTYYQKAMVLLATVELDDTFHLLDIRRMLVRCYYELQEWDALDALIRSFRRYLNRHKEDLTYHYDNYSHFITFVERLRMVREGDFPKRGTLRAELDRSEQVAERRWLEGKLA